MRIFLYPCTRKCQLWRKQAWWGFCALLFCISTFVPHSHCKYFVFLVSTCWTPSTKRRGNQAEAHLWINSIEVKLNRTVFHAGGLLCGESVFFCVCSTFKDGHLFNFVQIYVSLSWHFSLNWIYIMKYTRYLYLSRSRTFFMPRLVLY